MKRLDTSKLDRDRLATACRMIQSTLEDLNDDAGLNTVSEIEDTLATLNYAIPIMEECCVLRELESPDEEMTMHIMKFRFAAEGAREALQDLLIHHVE